jgi:hypothetical protein
MQHFNDNILNILKSTNRMILASKQSIKKDLRNIATRETLRFCRINGYDDISKASPAMVEALEDSIWCAFDSYGAF